MSLVKHIKKHWWKALAGVLLLYAVIGGFFIKVSFEGMEVAAESMRNIFYHVGCGSACLPC